MKKYMGKKKEVLLFYLLMIAVIGWFVVAETVYPSERIKASRPENLTYRGTFTWEKNDGTSQEITVPGKYPVGVDETMVLVTRLPDDFTQTSFAIRSSLQDVRFYVDGELRSEYNTDKTRLNGKNSASRYVFCPTSEKDAGKMLQIELTTHTDNYSGVVNTVYCGDKGDIWASIFHDYGLETIIAFFLLFVGLVTIIFSVALGIAYHTRFDMEYLGWCILMGAAWMLGESKLRQLWIPNVSILSAVCFLVILLCPVPVLIYMDSVQKKRYTRMYHAIGYAAVADFVVCTLLHLAGVKDFIETLPVSQGILVITFLTVCITFGIDFVRKRAGEYGLTLIGMLIAMMAVVVEVVSTYYVVVLSGIFTGIGMLVLLFANIVRTVQSVRDMEIQKKRIEKENYDHLTGLPMRSRGEAMIADLIMEQDGCLVFCDMDNLKKINDIYGHKAGDRALGCLGTLLKDVGEPSVACRLGGDEFLLFLPEATKEQAQERIKQLFAQFIEKKDEDVEMHAASLSAGLCMCSRGGNFEEYYNSADKALYYVKQNGKGSYFFYEQMKADDISVQRMGKDLEVVAHALKESGSYSGALDLDYRDFAKIYEYMNSLGARCSHTCYLVMVTVDGLQEQMMYNEEMEEALECMEASIRQKIRKVDICTRYSSMQYLIILFEPQESQIPYVMELIFEQYYKMYNENDYKPRYEYMSMLTHK